MKDYQRLTREGVTANKLGGDVQLATELADFVLEQFTQRLNQLQAMACHQTLSDTANVVMSLDSLRWALERYALNDI